MAKNSTLQARKKFTVAIVFLLGLVIAFGAGYRVGAGDQAEVNFLEGDQAYFVKSMSFTLGGALKEVSGNQAVLQIDNRTLAITVPEETKITLIERVELPEPSESTRSAVRSINPERTDSISLQELRPGDSLTVTATRVNKDFVAKRITATR